MTNPNRRTALAVLAAGAASSVALAVPAVAAVKAPEDPYRRAKRLGKEMAEALADIQKHPLCPDSLVSIVHPAGHPFPSGLMDGEAYAEWHLRSLKADPDAELAQVERLITNWQAAVAEHDRLFDDQDAGGGTTNEAVQAALDPIDNALEALCSYRPSTEEATARRSDFLSRELPRATYGCEGLMERMYRALTA